MVKRRTSKRRKRRRRKSQKGAGYSAQTDSADAVLTNYHENTKKQHEVQNQMNNQYGGKKMRGGSKKMGFADVTSNGSSKVVQQQLDMQNTIEQAKHEDSLAHCSDGSCKKGGRKKRRKSHKMKHHKGKAEKKTKKAKKGKKKRKLNQFFVLMLDAKKKGLKSFKYKKNTYVGTKKKHLGMVYKKM